MGKCLLCDYKLDELTELFFKDGGRLPPQLNLYRAHIQMEETRITNLAYEYGEVEPGIQCVASPIRVQDRVVAALGVISAVVPGESGEGDDGGESLTGVDTEDRKHSLHDG
ncbi:MAG: IclR family transcriptional regulator C-terminal domain-containing protein [Dysosmobacter sp.]